MSPVKKCILILLSLFTIHYSLSTIATAAQDEITAVVNGDIITKAEFNMYFNLLKMQAQAEKEDSSSITARKTLDGLIEDKLINQEAKKEGIQIDERLIDSRVERIKKDFRSEADFLEELSRQGLSLLELKERIRSQLLTQEMVTKQVRLKIYVAPREVTEYYKNNIKDFTDPERISVESIFVATKEDAQKIYNQIKKGANFADLKKQYSTKASLGVITKGKLKKEIEDVIFKLNKDEFSIPIETQDGYYIFLVKEKSASKNMGLLQAQEKIYNIIYEQKFSKIFKEWIDGLKKEAYIIIKDKSLNLNSVSLRETK